MIIRAASLLAFASLVVAACNGAYSEAPSGDAGVAEEAGPDDSGGAGATDASMSNPDAATDAADAAPCNPDSVFVDVTVVHSALLDLESLDAGATRVCDLSSDTCLLSFDLGDFAAKRIFAVTLTLQRAVGDDCESPTNCANHRTAGTVLAQHMRADWNQGASYATRSIGASWSAPGASGPDDVGGLSQSASVAPNDTALFTFDGSALDPRFLPSADQTLLAFRISPLAPFQFLIRRVELAPADTFDLATARVQFCQ